MLEEDEKEVKKISKKNIDYYKDVSDFTNCQKSKEDNNFRDVLDELKKKFKE